MSFCDLLAAKLLLFQIIETLFIIKFKEKIMKTQAVEPTSWAQGIEGRGGQSSSQHTYLYIGHCYATEHVMTKKYIIDFLAFSLLKKQKTSPSGLNLV